MKLELSNTLNAIEDKQIKRQNSFRKKSIQNNIIKLCLESD